MLDYKIFDLHFSYGDSKFKWKNVLFFLFQRNTMIIHPSHAQQSYQNEWSITDHTGRVLLQTRYFFCCLWIPISSTQNANFFHNQCINRKKVFYAASALQCCYISFMHVFIFQDITFEYLFAIVWMQSYQVQFILAFAYFCFVLFYAIPCVLWMCDADFLYTVSNRPATDIVM